MPYPCRGNCNKVYSTVFNRNKHEKISGHWVEKKADVNIDFNEETQLYYCPSQGCKITAKYKYNISHPQSINYG